VIAIGPRKLAAAVLLVAAGGATAVILDRLGAGRDVRGSSTVEFVTSAPATTASTRTAERPAWPMFGRDGTRQAALQNAKVRPPYRRVWVAGGRSLIEFPPAIAYGHLYYADGGGRVYAVSTATGSRDWQYDARRGSAATPAVGPYAHGTVYAAFLNPLGSRGKVAADGAVVALAAGTGRVRWSAHVGASETSPLLAEGRVFVGGWDGKVSALDAASGRRLWTFRTGGAVKGGLAAAGGLVYAGSYDGHVYALAAATGRPVWRASGSPQLFGHGTFYATPVVAYGRVYVGSTDGRMYSFGARSGKLRWSHHTGGYVYGSAAVWHRLVLVGSYDHRFYAFDAATGAERWSFEADGPISGSATVIGGIAYFATLHGRVYAVTADDGDVIWTFGDGAYAPAVSDGSRLYVVGYSVVYGLRPAPN
jgi:outer membrane protein assembly factor BamB